MSSSSSNYYDVLGVSKDATAEEVKRSYRKKALEAHPDKGGTADRISELNEAYSVLSDPDKRARYDMGENVPPTATPEDMREFLRNLFKSDPSQLFRDMFPQPPASAMPKPQASRRVQRPQDIFFELNLSYAQLYAGCNKKLAVRRMRFCTSCRGNGTETTTENETFTCANCNGCGSKVTTTTTFLGNSTQTTFCSACAGTGLKAGPEVPRCGTCKGKRVLEERAVLEVAIEPGTPVGWQVCCAGEGNDSLLAVSGRGDVVLKVVATLPPKWTREGQDLIHHVDIGLGECVSGYTFPLLHPAGHYLRVSIPVVIVPTLVVDGDLVAVWSSAGQGMPEFHDDPAGELVLVFHVKFPSTTLDLFRDMASLFLDKTTTHATDQTVATPTFQPVMDQEWLSRVLVGKPQTRFFV